MGRNHGALKMESFGLRSTKWNNYGGTSKREKMGKDQKSGEFGIGFQQRIIATDGWKKTDCLSAKQLRG
jgi:hypothetical protein